MKKLSFIPCLRRQVTVAVIVGLAGAFAAYSLPAQAGTAGTLTLSPAAKIVSKGQVFTVAVTANPAGSSVYTVRASVRYPANLLEVRSFAFASGWLPLPMPGADMIDNAAGSLVKTAGYTGGVASSKVLGTITFRAKATGVAQVSVAGDSQMFDANSANSFSGGNTSTVTVQQAAATTAVSPQASPAPSVSGSPAVSESPLPNDLQAASFLGLTGRSWGGLGLVAVGVFVLWYFVLRRRKPSEPMSQ